MTDLSPLASPGRGPAVSPLSEHRRRWRLALSGVACSVAVAVVIGVPTGVLPTPWFTRMTAVTWWAYPMWACTALLIGVATARRAHRRTRPRTSGPLLGGVGTALAVGCPACNKAVVLALGAPAATGLWASVQPVVGLAAVVGLFCAALGQRRREATARPQHISPSARQQLWATSGAMCLVPPTLVTGD